jgi:WW domain-containing oxidoreductase
MFEANTYDSRSTADDVLAGLDLKGRTILVTGCNSGLGFETIRALASHGTHIIGLARSLQSARDACNRVGGTSTPVACDLGDLTSVVAAADMVSSFGRPLDAIITNAGVMCPKTLTVRCGIELQFLVNHIAHFLLVNRLLGLVPSRTGRIVIVSSSASIDQAPKEGIMFDNLDGHRFYKPFKFYGQSKLANALFAKQLAIRVQGMGIAVDSLHPGAVGGTSLQRSLGFPLNFAMKVAQHFMKSIPQGAATQTLLAAGSLVQGITGEYWSDCQVTNGSPYLNDPNMAQRLWTVSEEIVAKHAEVTA